MSFENFAIEHGLLINSLELNKWVRVGTVDHPQKKNGAYIFDGHTGALINFALHDKHIIYKSKDPYVHDPNAVAKRQQLHKERLERQEKAKRKADYIVSQTTQSTHPYMIRTKGASLMIEKMAGRDIVCEGLATAMSVRRAMHHLCVPYRIHICFSANNMVEIASCLANPLVIADHDDTGIRCAKKIASTYWLGEAGEDFNDAEQRQGTAVVADSLRSFLYSTSPTL